jgi:hypothetical protein
MTRLRAAWRGLRTGTTYADGYNDGNAHREQLDQLVDKAIVKFAVTTATDHVAARTTDAFDDKLADVLAVRAMHARRPRLTLAGGAS